MTDTVTDTGVVMDQPPLSIAQAPSFCRLCNVELRGLQTWRAHVKSDGHVYKLQLKVAEPGSVPSPPPPPPSTDAEQAKSATPSRARKSEPDVGSDQDQNGDSDQEDEPLAPDFVPGKCVFCPQESGTLDDSMTHMAAVHGFSVPFQDCLAVDLETVVWYLHFVIYGYQECICCGARRSTVEGVQQHMVAKGHCRFDISPDTEEFYELPQSENVVIEQAQRDGSMPARLPSGKLISNRKNLDTQEPRPARRATPDRDVHSFDERSKTSSTPGLEVAQRGGNGSGEIVHSSVAILAAQLSKLRIAGDRAQHKEEERKRGRLERANNTILTKHFRLDSGDSRIGRKF
ncbi:C2H2 type zinc-finger-domain-containing protein [Ilyonectria destructans]|nr:C2H2 type zinc-finger-domain-containing protein [Ilyonectria destructans]